MFWLGGGVKALAEQLPGDTACEVVGAYGLGCRVAWCPLSCIAWLVSDTTARLNSVMSPELPAQPAGLCQCGVHTPWHKVRPCDNPS